MARRTISIPSLWQYLTSLGGSYFHYGLCISGFAFFRLSAMGLFGMWVDRRPYKEIYGVSLLISIFAALLYASGPAWPVGRGLWAVVIGRCVLGAMSAESVATQAFVSTNTRVADRTRYMAINTLTSKLLTIAGPVFNLVIVALPHLDLTLPLNLGRLHFDNFTWVGYFLVCGQLLILAAILCVFEEPQRRPRKQPPPLEPCGSRQLGSCVTLGGLFPWARVWVDPWLRKTNSWVMLFLNFRNNYTMFAVTYAIPLIADRDYGYGQLKISYIFVVITATAIIATAVLGVVSAYVSDRNLLCGCQAFSWGGLLLYQLLASHDSYAHSLASHSVSVAHITCIVEDAWG